MKFLIDNQLPPALARWLISHRQQALHVLDVRLSQAKDNEVWHYAEANALITKDEDFSRKATAPGAKVRVVWVRLGNCRTATLLAVFDSLLPQVLAAFEGGARLVEVR